MKRIATLLLFTALSTPALAETQVDRNMHSWDYVQSVANPPAPAEAPAVEHHEQRPYYHHEGAHEGKEGKHHGKHHHHHHDGAKKHAGHHHHHHKKADKEAPKSETK